MSDVINVQALRSMREAKGWDQLTLARAAGVDPSVISRLERGIQVDFRASVLVALARALQTSVDSLLVTPHEQTQSAVVLELAVVYAELAQLPPAQQRQIAAILRAYLSALPDINH